MNHDKVSRLVQKIISLEQTSDVVKRIYWFKHMTRLLSLARHRNIFGA